MTHMTKHLMMAACLVLSFGSFACDSEDNVEPSAEAGRGGRAGRAGRGGGGAGGSEAGEGGSTSPDAGEAGSGGSEGGAGGAGGEGGEGACFSGEPTETTHYLNRCTDSECESFDNAARLPLLGDDGELPELP
ncbi:MAG: hypothetical protein ABW321_12500 [Polyangiales bacterium]